MRRDYSFDFDDEERQTSSLHRLNMHPVVEPEKKGRMFTRGQGMSMVLAVGLLVYALVNGDVPLIFLLLSFLSYLLRPLAEKIAGVSEYKSGENRLWKASKDGFLTITLPAPDPAEIDTVLEIKLK